MWRVRKRDNFKLYNAKFYGLHNRVEGMTVPLTEMNETVEWE